MARTDRAARDRRLDRAVKLSAEGALMGYVWLAAIGTGAFALLAWKVDRVLWSMVASALMLGAAGYAWQGQPGLVGHTVSTGLAPTPDDSAMLDLRDRMLERYTGAAAYLVAADAMTRIGDRRAAVRVLLGGIRIAPKSLVLWTGLANALAAHDGNQVSPSALFAYQQAARLAPKHPAPPFFLGLAYVRAGEFEKARPYWAKALALTPSDISYRGEITTRLALLDRFLAMQDMANAGQR
ncbi:tetratricopeptide repeat protein [Sphingomonas sp. PB2P12]|uniref:tetratricopeptide repeat protein n=1 Tax=Sphingomonas sandaracina TaxID=3096157 RepID=UPI002FC81C96